MSTALSRTLHDAVDPGRPDADLDVAALSDRIRRRRAVRSGTRAAVGVGAAGAVALGSVQVLGSSDGGVGPAGTDRSDAALCGTDVADLPLDTSGSWVVLGPDDDMSAAVASVSGTGPAWDGGDLGTADRSSVGFAMLRAVGPDTPRPGERMVLVQGGEVVAWGRDDRDVDLRWNELDTTPSAAAPGRWEYGTAWVAPRACDGDASVPVGSYDAYIAQPGGATFVGPSPVDLVAAPPAAAVLPEGFPLDDVPLPDGVLMSASDNPEGGWRVGVRVVGDAVGDAYDPLVAAQTEFLEPSDPYRAPGGVDPDRFPDGAFLVRDRWLVAITTAPTDDGAVLLTYDVVPADR